MDDFVAPTLTVTAFYSNSRLNSTYAKAGDLITISLTANEPIQPPSITSSPDMRWQVTSGPTTFDATASVSDDLADSPVTFVINYIDAAGNAGTAATTAPSVVVIGMCIWILCVFVILTSCQQINRPH